MKVSEEQAGQRSVEDRRWWVSRLRDRIRATPGSRHVYRVLVGVVGLAIALGGLALVPLPGPGWLIVFVGLAILASEFAWAQRLLDFGRARLRAWTQWMKARPLWVRVAIALVTAAFVAGVVYLLVIWRGLPDWVPDWILQAVPLGVQLG
jgi:uncharacterized protein (TIGR02611 family)